ncbi:MAG: GTPase ObgE, partial [Dehalococcoidales bacterium]|nr:GTPase ObgE [Dehalococcoidales bacterium]
MLDKVKIRVQGGNGGDGAISFRHEKFVPFGGPDGGDGGKGGDVIFVADARETNLGKFQPQRRFKADNGGNGGGQKKHGRNGE